jgi:hypothetical protein
VFPIVSKNIKIKINRTIKLFVLYVCRTWLVTLREEHRLRILMNRVPLRKIVGPKREELM